MRFIERITQVFKADAHGVVDALEDKPLLLRQHLREAELELRKKRAHLQALDLEEKRLVDEGRRLNEAVAALDGDVALALDEQQTDLARFAIRRLLPMRARVEGIGYRMKELIQDRDNTKALLHTQEQDFESLKNRVRGWLAENEGDVDPLAAPSVTDEDVELELLRRARGARAEVA